MQQLVLSRPEGAAADFDALIGPHLEAGYGTALAILGNRDEAHDAVQESAFKAWRKLAQLHEGKPARPWFLAIVANQCRSEKRRHWWSVIRLPEIETGESHKEEGGAQKMDIDRELAKLPREDRQGGSITGLQMWADQGVEVGRGGLWTTQYELLHATVVN